MDFKCDFRWCDESGKKNQWSDNVILHDVSHKTLFRPAHSPQYPQGSLWGCFEQTSDAVVTKHVLSKQPRDRVARTMGGPTDSISDCRCIFNVFSMDFPTVDQTNPPRPGRTSRPRPLFLGRSPTKCSNFATNWTLTGKSISDISPIMSY